MNRLQIINSYPVLELIKKIDAYPTRDGYVKIDVGGNSSVLRIELDKESAKILLNKIQNSINQLK